MNRCLFLWILCLCCTWSAQAQKTMSPPKIMVVPDELYCRTRGYVSQASDGSQRPDYKRALAEDRELHPVLVQIKELIMERNSRFVIIDLQSSVSSYESDKMMNLSNGADESETVDEAIIRNSDADVLIKVNFDVLKNGPQRQIQFTITGTDAYTNQQFAPVTGVGSPSTAATVPILVREAIFGKMDTFLDQVLAYYNNMQTYGRAVSFYFKVLEGSQLTMESPAGEYTLGEVIEDALYDNSVDGIGLEQSQGGSTFMLYKSVHIPLMAEVRGRMRKQNANDVARRIASQLKEYGIECTCKRSGLGKVYVYLN